MALGLVIDKINDLWQSQYWENLQKKNGNTCFRVGNLLLIKKKLPFNKNFYEIPRGFLSIETLEKIKKQAKKENVIFCRVAPVNNYEYIDEKIIKKYKIYTSNREVFPEATRVINLGKNEQEILKSFSSTCRRHIKIAEKNELDFIESDDIKKYTEFSKTTAERDGFVSNTYSHFINFLESFNSKAKLFVLKDKNENWLSAGIFVFLDDVAYYYYGASDIKYRQINAPTLLQWKVMQYAKNLGCKYYDLLGVSKTESIKEKLYGVSRFKSKFKGELIFYEKEFCIPFSYQFFLYNALSKLKKIIKRS